MDRGKEDHRDLLEALRGVRALLAGCLMAGIRDWPAPTPSSEATASPAPSPGFELPPRPDPASPEAEAATVPATDNETLLSGIAMKTVDCRRCRLHTGRSTVVFGEGACRPRLVFVGEGPGYDEDQQGRPFVGRAGKLLDKMIGALGFQRGDVYICNVVKCRPPENRTPNTDEIEACSPFLFEQLEALKPEVICALGVCAAQTLLSTASSMSRIRGKIQRWRGIPLVCTFHPAYLLRSPSQKANAWQDMLVLRRLLNRGEKQDG